QPLLQSGMTIPGRISRVKGYGAERAGVVATPGGGEAAVAPGGLVGIGATADGDTEATVGCDGEARGGEGLFAYQIPPPIAARTTITMIHNPQRGLRSLKVSSTPAESSNGADSASTASGSVNTPFANA